MNHARSRNRKGILGVAAILLALVAMTADDVNRVSGLLLTGKRLFDSGRQEEAEQKWSEALVLDARNPVTAQYLRLIEGASARAGLALSNAVFRSSAAFWWEERKESTAKRLVLQNKLDSIVLDSVEFDGLSLSETRDKLSHLVEAGNSTNQRIHFLIDDSPAQSQQQPADPATGLPLPITEEKPSSTIIRLTPALPKLTLRQVLESIVKTADRPLKYCFQNDVIVFSIRTPADVSWETRIFKIEREVLSQGLQRVMGIDPNKLPIEPVPVDTGPGLDNGLIRIPPDPIETLARQFLNAAGVDFSTPPTVVYNRRKGLLFIRAKAGDFEVVERAIKLVCESTSTGVR